MTRLVLAYLLALVGFLILADLGLLRPLGDFVHGYPVLDKVIHFVMYGMLALLANITLARQYGWPVARAIATGSILVVIASTVEEWSNLLVVHRHWSLGDLAANYLGILCLGILPLLRVQQKPALE